MNDEWLENELRRLPAPDLPAAWRAEILATARRARMRNRTAWPPLFSALRLLLARNPVTAGALAALWLLILALRMSTPADPAARELLAHLDSHAPPPDWAAEAEQIRLAEEWTSWSNEPPIGPRP